MEKMNIHQRAIDTINRFIDPDLSQGGGGGASDAVQYIPQTLTEAQKMQARKNQGLYWSAGDSATWDGDTTGLDVIMSLYFRVPAFGAFLDPSKISAFVLNEGSEVSGDDMEWTDYSGDMGLPDGTILMEESSGFAVILTDDCDMDFGEGPAHYLKGLYAANEGGGYLAEVHAEEISKIPNKFIDLPAQVVKAGEGKHSTMFGDFYAEATGEYSVTEGEGCEASGDYSHAECAFTKAAGESSHAEGSGSHAEGNYSHAEGTSTQATAIASHAEGGFTLASGDYSHTEGRNTKATGIQAHAEGRSTNADGDCSHAEGYMTTAAGEYQHVSGKFNVSDTNNKYAVIVGNGGDEFNRHNAFMVDWDGGIIVPASDNPSKYFKITVNSSGNITATEVTI